MDSKIIDKIINSHCNQGLLFGSDLITRIKNKNNKDTINKNNENTTNKSNYIKIIILRLLYQNYYIEIITEIITLY